VPGERERGLDALVRASVTTTTTSPRWSASFGRGGLDSPLAAKVRESTLTGGSSRVPTSGGGDRKRQSGLFTRRSTPQGRTPVALVDVLYREEPSVPVQPVERKLAVSYVHNPSSASCISRVCAQRWANRHSDRLNGGNPPPLRRVPRIRTRRSRRGFALPAAACRGLVKFAFPVAGPAATRSRTTPSPMGNPSSFQLR
jgi:hypothetical protein